MRKSKDILVLDLETQRSFDEVGGRHNLEKLKVSLVGLYSFQQDKFMTFLENELKKLEKILQEAEVIIGFNIRKFDYPVLAPYLSFDPRRLPSLDIMQEIEGQVGHRVSLDSVAVATLGCSKTGDGLEAISMFRQGRLEELKNYCLDDVKITRDIFNFGRLKNKIYFVSDWGKKMVRVNWQFPEVEKKEILEVKLQFDHFELIDIYQSLLIRRAVGEITENDDESEAINKIEEAMTEEDVKYCHQRTKEVMESLNETVLDFDDEEDYEEERHFWPKRKRSFTIDTNLEKDIEKAFKRKQRIEIDYESASTQAGEPFLKKRQIDIYEITGGYFQGFCHLRKEIRQFRMDRVVSFKILDAKYKIPKEWKGLS